MLSRIASASLTLVWSVSVAQAAGPVLQPTGKWAIDYGETQCTAARSFGNSSAPVTLGIVPSLNGSTYKLLVTIPRAGPAFAQQSRGSLDFGQGETKADLLYFGDKDARLSVYQLRVPAATIQQMRSASAVTFHSNKGADYAFALSDMPELLDGLRKCSDNLAQYWNMDGRNIATSARSTAGDIRSLFSAADYPAEALKTDQQGRVQYELLVNEKGEVAGCDVLASSGIPVLDSMGCELLKIRASFTPARDSQGKPIRSMVATPPVLWKSVG